MLITTKFDIGDKVLLAGNIDAVIIRIMISPTGMGYECQYWDDRKSISYIAYDFEIKLVESISDGR